MPLPSSWHEHGITFRGKSRYLSNLCRVPPNCVVIWPPWAKIFRLKNFLVLRVHFQSISSLLPIILEIFSARKFEPSRPNLEMLAKKWSSLKSEKILNLIKKYAWFYRFTLMHLNMMYLVLLAINIIKFLMTLQSSLIKKDRLRSLQNPHRPKKYQNPHVPKTKYRRNWLYLGEFKITCPNGVRCLAYDIWYFTHRRRWLAWRNPSVKAWCRSPFGKAAYNLRSHKKVYTA